MAKTRALKVFLTVQNDIDSQIVQSSVLTLINDGSVVIENDYAKLYSGLDIGNYSISIISDQAILEFFPTDGKINDYSYGYVYYDTKKFIQSSSSIIVSDSVSIGSSNTTISIGSSGTILALPEKFSSSKVVVEITSADDEFEFNEINIASDKNGNIYSTEYGRLNINVDPASGIGTYNCYKDGESIKVDFFPFNINKEYTCNTVSVSLAKTDYSAQGEQQLRYANLSSNKVIIPASSSPVLTTIMTHSLDYQSAYYLIQVTDLTNNRVDFSELYTLNNLTESYGVLYGRVVSDVNLGDFEINTSGKFEVFFTPLPNIETEVLVFQQSLGFTQFSEFPSVIDLKNSQIVTSVSKVGTNDENNNRTNFNLTYKDLPIFERAFDASDPFNVNLQQDLLYLPNHFFVTGEKVSYRSQQFNKTSTVKSIGIAATSISGIGVTDKLPFEAYVYKFDNARIGLCSSPNDALSVPPKLFDFTSLGVDTLHYITATDQNSKAIIAIDNIIQSPIVSTSITSSLIQDVNLSDLTLVFSGITSFFSGDIIKVNNEIMKIESVGVGSTGNVGVVRPWLGTGISSHYSGNTVTKLKGNYNIINNVIHFSDAPYGPFPEEDEFKDSQSTSLLTLAKSRFQGRTFIRSANPLVLEDTYNKNYLFDDLSYQFNSTENVFELTQSGVALTDVSNNNSIVLINNILQIPNDDFIINELGSSTELEFTGTATTMTYDPNLFDIPRGGVILSIGSSSGLGYQPLVCAGGTASVSIAGTIQSISIGNSGSGYRQNYQLVKVGVQTFSSTSANVEFVGTATISNGNIVGVSITNPGIGYTAYPFVYSTTTSEQISIGSTIIPLVNTSKVPRVNPIIQINSIFDNVPIVSVADTCVFISAANAAASIIPIDTDVNIKEYELPLVIFDEPLSYSDIPLVYSNGTGIGTEATIDIVVGQGSSVIDFKIKNFGYKYNINDVLTLPIQGNIGIPTTPGFSPFLIYVTQVFNDSFSGWSIGSLRLLDDVSYLINNRKRTFPLMYQGNRFAVVAKPGSNIDIQSTLLVFVNDILQEPGIGYVFNGGSTITLSEPLKRYPNGNTDKFKIIFYRGTEGIDVIDVDILETIKVGDVVKLDSENYAYQQDSRLVQEIPTVDVAKTNLYKGKGIYGDSQLLRPLTWTRQKDDIFIDGSIVTKDRPIYEPLIFPSTGLIRSVGIGSTQLFVQNVKTFFENDKENNNSQLSKTVEIISQDNLVSASATVTVNNNGEISSVNLVNSGDGYYTSPKVYIQNPVGVGSTAIITSNISNKKIISFNIVGVGSGYTDLNPPLVAIEPPTPKVETISGVNYTGDFGIISGIAFTSIVGVAQTGLVLDLLVPANSYLRTLDPQITTSEIKPGYFFEINNSNIGNKLNSLTSSGNIIGIGTTSIDNVYEVISVSIAQTSAYGIGLTDVAKVVVSVENYNGLSGLGFSNYYGNYNWGLIDFELNRRVNPKEFTLTTDNGVIGLNTTPLVRRKAPLKYFNYST
jgi:hypothetical protein